jgi:hypothetical protein
MCRRGIFWNKRGANEFTAELDWPMDNSREPQTKELPRQKKKENRTIYKTLAVSKS